MKIIALVLLAAFVQIAEPAKILTILPVGVKSHSILFDRLLKELAHRGHEITYITPYKSNKVTKNIREILIPDMRTALMGNYTNMMQFARIPSLFLLPSMPYMTYRVSDAILDTPEVKELMETGEFDLIFGEPYMNEPVIAGFSYWFKAPLVTLSTFIPNVWANYAVGNPAPSSYIPDPFYPVVPPLSFLQRTSNVLRGAFGEFCQRIGLLISDRVMRRHFGNDAPCIMDILTNTSLLLVNHHPVMTFARPQTPNTIDVGGMHIYPPKPLPEDLEKFMSSAKDGVVLFSMGTNVNCSDLPTETIQSILKGLGKLKQKVIWKFDAELENVPENVVISKWLPQSDILAHPNLKLFITHGGLLSTTEAVFRGVPIVGIPVMADQPINMQHTENAGLGVTLDLWELNGETLYEAATEVLYNPKYREVAKEKSRLLRDTPMTPLDTAVWWMEFVLRTKGAAHLRSPGRNLWWYQRHLIDVYIFLAIVGFVSTIINWYLLKFFYRKIVNRCSKSKSSIKKNKNKKKN